MKTPKHSVALGNSRTDLDRMSVSLGTALSRIEAERDELFETLQGLSDDVDGINARARYRELIGAHAELFAMKAEIDRAREDLK